jgi:hypothetical protein
MRCLPQKLLLSANLMDVSIGHLNNIFFIRIRLFIGIGSVSFYCTFFLWSGRRCIDLTIKFYFFLSFSLFLLVIQNIPSFLLDWLFFVLRLGLIEITVKLISPRTALNVVLPVIIPIFEIPEIILAHLLPKRVFLLLLLFIHQIVHFGPSLFSESHLLDGQILWRDLRL